MHRFSNKGLASILLVLLVALFAVVATADQVATGTKGMVATAHELASQAGAEILAAGGNAIDAAVAAAFAITVVEPNASSLGGEGYMVLSLADGRDLAIDYRSSAPGHVNINTDRSPRTGPESTCTPGLVAGLCLALQEYGTMSLSEVLADRLSDLYGYTDAGTDPVVGPIYFPDGLIPEPGSLVVNKDLAHALGLIAEQGAYAFYRGEIAAAIVEAMNGFYTSADLQRYQAVVRDALVSEYRGHTVIGTPPIVAGIVVAETLNILDNFDLSVFTGWDNPGAGWDDPGAIHIISQALLLASADRKPYIGDPDFYDVPLEGLLSEEYASARAGLIDLEHAISPTYSAPIGNPELVHLLIGAAEAEESPSTTQISVLDADLRVLHEQRATQLQRLQPG
jgi:gamma-glutamyltranspeptidase/glutathione hydrolase